MTKNEEWNKLIGKTILVYDPDFVKWGLKPIQSLKIVGCDPDIAICIAHPLKHVNDVYWVSHGISSPKMRNKAGKLSEEQKQKWQKRMDILFDQLRSGYFSIPTAEKLHNEELISQGHLPALGFSPVCPFSL